MNFDKEKFLGYCKENISHYESRLDYAWEKIDKYRCPLSFADEELYNDICNCLEDYCSDNFDEGEIDVDELLCEVDEWF